MNNLLLRLRDKGNTVLVVEHKPETIAIADHVVDLGPGAGTAAARSASKAPWTACGPATRITGRHLDDRATLKPTVRTPKGKLEIRGATATTCRMSMSTFRSGCSAWSPAWRVPARAR